MLGNAQIKSAMIESLSANKVTAGDIITNDVRVMSEDGSLVIADETIQISDGTRVRVQIGKDTSSDYSINIWDADGNLMFSEGGITDSAIKDAIIRNDMVSADANISASKLDIESLFSEINGSSNTIKSSKIYLDDEGQTLDVAFTTLDTKVDGLGETVTSQGTQISVIQGQITSKIWQSDIETAVDDIEIGGRNYFARSKMNTLAWTGTGLQSQSYYRGYSFPVNEGETYTVYRTNTTNNRWAIYWFNEEPVIGSLEVFRAMRNDTQEAYVVTHLIVPAGITWGFIYLSNQDDEIPNIMLEKGNKASDWSPAPEDVENDISILSTKYSTLEQTIDGVSATVGSNSSSILDIDSRMSTLELDLSGFRTTVSETYATKDELTIINSTVSENADSIESLVSRTIIVENKFADYFTAEEVSSAITQESDSILLSVSESYATKTELGNLEIGGRNHFRPDHTVDLGCTGAASGDASLIHTGTCKGFYVAVSPNEEWTISRADTSNNRFDYCFTIDEPVSGISIYEWNTAYRNALKIEGIVVPEGYNYLFFYLSNQNDDVSYVKIERGNRATDWTPAPEDMATAAEMSDANVQIQSAQSSITQLSNEISSNVTEIDGLGVRMSDVEQTADGLSVRLTTAETDISNVATDLAANYTVKTIVDTRNDNQSPAWYIENYPRQIVTEFKTASIIGLSGETFCTLSTYVPWNSSSGGYPKQVAKIGAKEYWRVGISDTEWGSWNDAVGSAENAAKTATDYLNLSTAGLCVGQNPANPTAGNTLISADGVAIRKGTTILAEFEAASRTVSGISSATLTSTDSTDSESDGITSVRGTINENESRATIYITTNGNPVYFPKGLETAKVLINDSSGIIANCNLLLNGSLVDNSGEGILTPLNSYGNMIIGYGRYQDGGATHVYGTRVKAKTKTGFSASVNGVSALDTNNSEGNATFGWHHYEANSGETNIYGYIASLFAKDTIRLNPNGNTVLMNGNLIPYDTNKYNLGSTASPFKNLYLSSENTGSYHGIRTTNGTSSYNVLGVNEGGYVVFGNTTYCTNLIGRSTTTSNTGYSFKITCGDNPGLVLGDNDARLFLFGGTDSTSRYIGSVAAYKRTYTSAANMVITDNSIIGRATSSSERYKKDIVELDMGEVSALYNMPVFKFKYKDDYIASTDERYGIDIPGFIAEKVSEFFPVACDHKVDSNGDRVPEMWNSQIIIPALLKLIQDLNSRLKVFEERGL